LRVLLIEDDASSSEAMRDLLEMSGHTVDCASNGREALDRLRQVDSYCVILLDVMMPVMNGYEFRDEQLKDPRIASIPVIVLTADGRAREKARRLRTSRFFQKPFSPPDLLRAIEQQCGASKSDEAPAVTRAAPRTTPG
jgi:CheY-like chemotaxis protein